MTSKSSKTWLELDRQNVSKDDSGFHKNEVQKFLKYDHPNNRKSQLNHDITGKWRGLVTGHISTAILKNNKKKFKHYNGVSGVKNETAGDLEISSTCISKKKEKKQSNVLVGEDVEESSACEDLTLKKERKKKKKMIIAPDEVNTLAEAIQNNEQEVGKEKRKKKDIIFSVDDELIHEEVQIGNCLAPMKRKKKIQKDILFEDQEKHTKLPQAEDGQLTQANANDKLISDQGDYVDRGRLSVSFKLKNKKKKHRILLDQDKICPSQSEEKTSNQEFNEKTPFNAKKKKKKKSLLHLLYKDDIQNSIPQNDMFSAVMENKSWKSMSKLVERSFDTNITKRKLKRMFSSMEGEDNVNESTIFQSSTSRTETCKRRKKELDNTNFFRDVARPSFHEMFTKSTNSNVDDDRDVADNGDVKDVQEEQKDFLVKEELPSDKETVEETELRTEWTFNREDGNLDSQDGVSEYEDVMREMSPSKLKNSPMAARVGKTPVKQKKRAHIENSILIQEKSLAEARFEKSPLIQKKSPMSAHVEKFTSIQEKSPTEAHVEKSISVQKETPMAASVKKTPLTQKKCPEVTPDSGQQKGSEHRKVSSTTRFSVSLLVPKSELSINASSSASDTTHSGSKGCKRKLIEDHHTEGNVEEGNDSLEEKPTIDQLLEPLVTIHYDPEASFSDVPNEPAESKESLEAPIFNSTFMKSEECEEEQGAAGDLTVTKCEVSVGGTSPRTPKQSTAKNTCQVCHKKFSLSKNLTRHLITHTPTSERSVFTCKICDKQYFTKRNFILHQNTHTTRTYECEDCDETFFHRSHLKSHTSVCHENRVVKCKLCNLGFPSLKALNGHLTTHIEKKHLCRLCDKTFSYHTHLDQHLLSHKAKETRTYDCEICPKKYKSRQNLHDHLRSHGDKPWECSDCQKKFYLLRQLESHTVVHAQQRPFACSTCEKTFKRKCDLKSHKWCHREDSSKGKTPERRRLTPVARKSLLKNDPYRDLKKQPRKILSVSAPVSDEAALKSVSSPSDEKPSEEAELKNVKRSDGAEDNNAANVAGKTEEEHSRCSNCRKIYFGGHKSLCPRCILRKSKFSLSQPGKE